MDVSDFFFSCSGRGKGESEALGGGGGDRFSIENPRRGGPPGREAEGPGGCLQRFGEFGEGGGLIFFFGAEMSTKIVWV